jgi:signal transduction histidine kinase
LRGRNNEPIGKIALLRDGTEQWRAQNRVVEQQRMVAKLQEREQLARELHDGIGQILRLCEHAGADRPEMDAKWQSADKARSIMGRIVEVAKDVHADIRESILTLRAGPEKKMSFHFETKKLPGQVYRPTLAFEPSSAISRHRRETPSIPRSEAQLLRVIQEALTNSRKHSGAKNLASLRRMDTRKALITVTDDGKRFRYQRARPFGRRQPFRVGFHAGTRWRKSAGL